MSWWIERYRRVGRTALVDDVKVPAGVTQEEITKALGVDGDIRFSEWPVNGPLMRLLDRKGLPVGYFSLWRRIVNTYFLGYRNDE